MSADESAAHIFRKERHVSGAHKNHERTKGLIMRQGLRQFYGQNKANYGILKHAFSKFGGNMLNNL